VSIVVGKRILIVEDDEDNAALLRVALGAEGYELVHAQNLGDAMNAVVASDPDIILLDIALPHRLEGLRLVDWYFSQASGRAKIIVLSAVGRDVLDEVRDDPRLAAVMAKPFSLEALLALVASVAVGD
jgi:two-component system, OmpR family, KDP operon response regulator KdpE